MADCSSSQYGQFPATRWSLVALAGADEGSQREFLAEFLKQYAPALRAHLLRTRRIRSELADDILQGFLCDKVIQGHLVAKAVREKGKLRWYLRAALDNYTVDAIRKESSRAHLGAGVRPLLPDEPDDPETSGQPSDAMDVVWARQIIQSALELMEAECKSSRRPDVWGVFEARVLTLLDGEEPLPYEELVSRYGLASPAQAMNVLTTAKRMYERKLRSVVAEYVTDTSEIEDEIRDLARILSGARA